jgi:chorismate dehydratase
VRVLLDGQELRFVDVPAGADPREAGTDAWLRIGDAALREHHRRAGLPVFNPAQEWSRRSGLPFVFALWIVRPGVELGTRAQAFAEARARGRRALPRAGACRQPRVGPAAGDLRALPRPRMPVRAGREPAAALLAFQNAAARLGLCQAGLEPAALSLAHVP